METPAEKAKELLNKFYKHIFDIDFGVNTDQDERRLIAAKSCVIEHVDQMLKVGCFEQRKKDRKPPNQSNRQYWESVKQAIIHDVKV